jgi:hypothetical protein
LDVAVTVVGVVVQVAAAEACGGDADLEFVCFGGGEGAGFLGVLLDLESSCAIFQEIFTVRRSFAPWRTDAWICVDMVACVVLARLVVLNEAFVWGEDMGNAAPEYVRAGQEKQLTQY